jgi:hypothetical protein
MGFIEAPLIEEISKDHSRGCVIAVMAHLASWLVMINSASTGTGQSTTTRRLKIRHCYLCSTLDIVDNDVAMMMPKYGHDEQPLA